MMFVRLDRKRIKKERLERFAPYFSYVTNNGMPVSSSEKKTYKHCGDRDNPNPCPPRERYNACFISRSALVRHLINNGFHKTADYASTIIVDNYNDYTKPIDAGCRFGVFRVQARIVNDGGLTYVTQSPEPNPEIHSYIWPHWWWGTYVAWWHIFYC